MRTSLNEIKLVDEYLLKQAEPSDKLLLEAMLVLDPVLAETITWHKNTHAIVKQYGRKKLKAEIEAVHTMLFNDAQHSTFRQRIWNFFK